MVPEDNYPPGVPSDLSVNNLVVANNATLNGPVVITNSVTSTLSVTGSTSGRVQIGASNASGNATLLLNSGTGGGNNIINTSSAPLLIQASGTTGITMGTAGGVLLGAATGGAQGVGTLNATAYYVNGTQVSAPTTANTAPGTLLSTTAITYVTPAFSVPANSIAGTMVAGQTWRIIVGVTNAATACTTTLTVKLGTTGTTTDTTIASLILGAGTAAAGSAIITIDVTVKTVGASGQGTVGLQVVNNGSTGFTNTNAVGAVAGSWASAVPTNVSTNKLGLCLTCSVANVVTVQYCAFQLLGSSG
jgi:hypothetical protein